jgi:SAM-dependent methyltransferase
VTDTHWPDYYDVTAERPAWPTVIRAAGSFAELPPGSAPRLAVDLGCGAGRDTRELLRRGWRVVAVDRTPEGIATLLKLTPPGDRPRLKAHVADVASFPVPACDLVNANLILPFLPSDAYGATWARIRAALPPGGRFSGMLFGDRDQAATDEPDMTCPSPEVIRGHLAGFRIEHWEEKEEDGHTALGEPHHFHLIEVVAVRLGDTATKAPGGDGGSSTTGDHGAAMDASTGGRAVG